MPQLKSKLIQKCKKETYATLKLILLHCVLPWCLNLFFKASSSMFGVRLCAEEILRIEWRCSSVRQLLCVGLFNFITEKSCSHRYVLPNRDHLSNLSTQLGHCVRDETWKLCSTNRVILRLECVATLEFDQLHLEVGWCAFHIGPRRKYEDMYCGIIWDMVILMTNFIELC